MKLIDKDALVAEIDKRIKILQKNPHENHKTICHLDSLKQYLNTTEVKEMDLDKEFAKWWKGERAKDYNVDTLYEMYSKTSLKLAKHFFELGLKAQKGI